MKFFIILLLGIFFTQVSADCVFRQDCYANATSGKNCTGNKVEPHQVHPFPQPALANGQFACPEYKDRSCCTLVQANTLKTQFTLIDFTFGRIASGGCPACYENLRAFYCGIVCSPNQSDFVKFVGIEDMIDPNTNRPQRVLHTKMAINAEYACAIYESCASTGKVKQNLPMKGCENFFNFQVKTESIGIGHSYMDVYYHKENGEVVTSFGSPFAHPGSDQFSAFKDEEDDDEDEEDDDWNPTEPLSVPVMSCCNFPANFSDHSYGNTSCPCGSCSGMCPGGKCNEVAPLPEYTRFGVMHGFDFVSVCIWYGIITLTVGAIVLWRRRQNAKKQE